MLWSLYPSPQIRSRASGPGVYRNVNVPITLSGAYSAKSSLAAAIWLSPRQSVNDQLSQLMVAPAIPPSSPPISTGDRNHDGLPFGERDVVHDSADASERRSLVAEAEQLHVVTIGVDAGQDDWDCTSACRNLCFNVGWCWRRLVFGVLFDAR